MAELKQKVFLEVWDSPSGGTRIFTSKDLRVDFDVQHIPEFSRATFTLWNLNDKTISSLMTGDLFVTLRTQLHDGEVQMIANRFQVNNAVDELKLPNRVTTLFCFDNLRGRYLEREVVTRAFKYPSLKDILDSLLHNIAYGSTTDDEYLSFPEGFIHKPSKRIVRHLNGGAQTLLRGFEKEFNFVTYTIDGRLRFMHTPSKGALSKTSLAAKVPDVILDTRSMRSNPRIGIATCTIHNNLDGSIKPTAVLDLSRLLTAQVDASGRTLEIVDDYLRNIRDNGIFQAFAVSHKGSNYTAEWSTRITGLSPTKGTLMSTLNWAGNKI